VVGRAGTRADADRRQMNAREQILGDIRRALGRADSKPPAPLIAALLRHPQPDRNHYTSLFVQNLEKLGGKCLVVPDVAGAGLALGDLLQGKRAVASNAPYLRTCGITDLAEVNSGFTDREALREACAAVDVGITSVEYALAETGTLVMLSSAQEARLISLLPPVHVAVFPQSRILGNLDELLAVIPQPAEATSAMVLITGPSRTADIEQILVRGVHGPGEVYAVIVQD
jgi:L-lactate dehydrogenase complex protein LldG